MQTKHERHTFADFRCSHVRLFSLLCSSILWENVIVTCIVIIYIYFYVHVYISKCWLSLSAPVSHKSLVFLLIYEEFTYSPQAETYYSLRRG